MKQANRAYYGEFMAFLTQWRTDPFPAGIPRWFGTAVIRDRDVLDLVRTRKAAAILR